MTKLPASAPSPDDTMPEPFCLKATDKYAVTTINYWLATARQAKVNAAKLTKARTHRDAIEAWQKANPDKVKVPD